MNSQVIQRCSSRLVMVRTKQKQLQMAPIFRLSLVPRRRCSTNAMKEIFVQDQIHFGLKKQPLDFKLTTRGHNIDITSSRIWKIGDKDTVGPYLGQDRALLTLLNTLWNNCSPEIGKKYSTAPRCAVIRREYGWGKSRFLSEWILQVFKQQRMLKQFIEEDEFTISKKKSFLNAIYWSAYRQYTVLINGSTIKSPIDAQTIPNIFKREILERFAGMEIELEGKKLKVTEKEIEGLESDAERDLLPTLFIQLCNAKYPAPQRLPYSNVQPHDFNYITFMLDDCHSIGSAEQKTESDPIATLWQMFAHYSGFIKLANVVPTILFSGENSMRIPNGVNTILLSSLLDPKVLPQISQTLFKKRWFVKFSDVIVEKSLPPLDREIGVLFQRHFFHTFGLPIALKNLIENSIELMNEILPLVDEKNKLWKKVWDTRFDVDRSAYDSASKHVSKLMKDMNTKLKQIHRHQNNNPKLVADDSHESLNIKAALCLPLSTSDATDINIHELIASGQLIEQHFASGESRLTLPIHNFSYKELTKPLTLLKSTLNTAPSRYQKVCEVSLASLVLSTRFKESLGETRSDVESFGVAVASTIYAKYRLKQLENPNGKVLLTDLIAHDFTSQPLFQDAHIAPIKGITSTPWRVDEDSTEPVICVVCDWRYDVVRLPVKIKNENYIVAIHCWSTGRLPSFGSLIKRYYDIQRKRNVKYLFIGTAPKIQDSKKLSQDETQVLYNAALVPAHEIVSPLYLQNMHFDPDFRC